MSAYLKNHYVIYSPKKKIIYKNKIFYVQEKTNNLFNNFFFLIGITLKNKGYKFI